MTTSESLNQDDQFTSNIPINVETSKFSKGRKNKNGKFTRQPSNPGINAC
jgi:hypothetical protein